MLAARFTLLLACVSCAACRTPLSQNPPLTARVGDDVTFSIQLPGDVQSAVVIVAFRRVRHPVLIAATAGSNLSAAVTGPYSARTTLPPTMHRGLVTFTLHHVTSGDGGRYLCAKGPTEADVVEGCGQTLVVVGAPENVSVLPKEAAVVGQDLALHCSAASTTVPPDARLPTRYRWFESVAGKGQSTGVEWEEVFPDGTDSGLDQPQHSEDIYTDDGSGEAVPELHKGSHSGSASNLLGVESLERSDENRTFACSASEGLDLWSQKSAPFVLLPEWVPTTSDMTLTPETRTLTLSVGQSADVSCSANCRPSCSVRWQKVLADTTVRPIPTTDNRTLALGHVTRGDGGHYRCLAYNRHGTAVLDLTLTLADSDDVTPWFSDGRHVTAVVGVATLLLAVGMTAVAVVVVRCRRRSSPIVWPHRKRESDAVPLTTRRSHQSDFSSF